MTGDARRTEASADVDVRTIFIPCGVGQVSQGCMERDREGGNLHVYKYIIISCARLEGPSRVPASVQQS